MRKRAALVIAAVTAASLIFPTAAHAATEEKPAPVLGGGTQVKRVEAWADVVEKKMAIQLMIGAKKGASPAKGTAKKSTDQGWTPTKKIEAQERVAAMKAATR